MKPFFHFAVIGSLFALLAACSSQPPVEEVEEETLVVTSLEEDLALEESFETNENDLEEGDLTAQATFANEELGSVFFLYDRVFIPFNYRAVVEAHAEYMHQNPHLTVVLEGHTDLGGSPELHHKIGYMRAEEVKKRLVSFGVSSQRITLVSHGSNKPLAAGSSTSEWQQNRRVDFIYSAN